MDGNKKRSGILKQLTVWLKFGPSYDSGIICIIADAASEPEASEQVSSSNSYWALKVRFTSVSSTRMHSVNRPECFACMML